MAEQPTGIQVTSESVVVNGINQPLEGVLRAEASRVEDLGRIGVIIVIALFGPILVMYAATLAVGTEVLRYWFGPATLVGTVACGLIAAAIGIAWKKPWGVVIERAEYGHSRLTRCGSHDEAESLARQINDQVARD